ncbi:MAG: restriction endonuclease subunit S [Proteobacteria bacterium]|nr:restriction endonuclease subunit S [Pseudomonadota bacterium]
MRLETFFAKFDLLVDAPDAAERMRELLLELAVRGALSDRVSDDQNDKVWGEFLAEIEKRAPETLASREMPFEIPSAWRWVCLDDLGTAKVRNDAEDDAPASFVPMASVSSMYGVAVQSEERTWGEIKKGFTHFADGDVVMAKITPCFENAKSGVMRNLVNGIGAGTTELHVFRRGTPVVLPEFVLLYVKTRGYISRGVPRMTGSAGQKRIPREYFSKSPFPLPPPAEQQRIVAKVDELMALCDRLEAQHQERETRHAALARASLARFTEVPTPANLSFLFHPSYSISPAELRKSVRNLAVQGKLVTQIPSEESAIEAVGRIEPQPRPARFEKRSTANIQGITALSVGTTERDIPSGWLCVPLIQIARLESGHTPSRARPDWWNGDVSWVGVVDARLHDGKVIFDTLQHTNEQGLANSAARMLPTGTVCVSRTASVGYVTILGKPMATSQDFVNWVPTGAVTSEWLQLVFTAEKDAFSRFSKGAVHQTIYYPEWLSMHTMLPPLAEQRRIVAKVDQLMALVDQLETQLATSRATATKLLEAIVAELTAA